MSRRAFRLLVLALALHAAAPAPASPPPHARVILYHRVGDPRHPSTDVSSEAFRAQMHWLRDNGYSVVSTRELEAFLLRGASLPSRAAVIHFDDGYRSVFDHAFPVLRELGYPFTVFLPTEAVDRRYPDFITWEMARAMAEDGATFGVHGHRHLRVSVPEGAGEGTRSAMMGDLLAGARRLREEGFPAEWVAYPYGEYTPQLLGEVRAAGFTLGFSQDPGAVGSSEDPFRIPRFAVVGTLGDMATFRERMAYLPLPLAERHPAPGVLAPEKARTIEAVVQGPMAFGPTVNAFVTEVGPVPATLDPTSGRVSAPWPQGLTRRVNRVLLSLRDRETGRHALGSWLILNPRVAP